MTISSWLLNNEVGLRSWRFWLLLLFSLGAGYSLRLGGISNTVDTVYTDAWHRMAGIRKIPSHVALVVIDDVSLYKFRDDPFVFWTKSHAKVVETLTAVGVKVIGFDMLFGVSPESWIKRFSGNEELARTYDSPFRKVLNSGKVVLAASAIVDDKASRNHFLLPHEDYLFSLPDFDFTSYVGLVNLGAGQDVIREFSSSMDIRLPASKAKDDVPKITFATLLALHATDQNPHDRKWKFADHWVKQGSALQPIFFSGPPGTIQRVPYSLLLEENPLKNETVKSLKNKVVIIAGDWGTDSHATPYSSAILGGMGQFMNGAEVHANIVETLLSGDRNTPVPAAFTLLLTIMVAAIGSLLFLSLTWYVGGITLIISTAALAGLSYFAFLHHSLLTVVPSQAALASAFVGGLTLNLLSESKKRARLKKLFGRYTSDAVVDKLLASGESPDMGGELISVTVLFADIRNFTTISERLSAKEVVTMLNAYFERLTKVILEEGGTVDKFIGDGIMAVFGSPAVMPDHATRGCRAALGIAKAVEDFDDWFRSNFPNANLPPFKIGIGLHSGEAIVGSIGSSLRSEFTTIGDVVNVASRVEGLTKEMDATIVATQETLSSAGFNIETGAAREMTVKGRSQPVLVYPVTGVKVVAIAEKSPPLKL